MTNTKKIELLKRLIEKSKDVINKDSSDPNFKVWKNDVERTLIKVFGDGSHEVKSFAKLILFYRPLVYSIETNLTAEHIRCFKRD